MVARTEGERRRVKRAEIGGGAPMRWPAERSAGLKPRSFRGEGLRQPPEEYLATGALFEGRPAIDAQVIDPDCTGSVDDQMQFDGIW